MCLVWPGRPAATHHGDTMTRRAPNFRRPPGTALPHGFASGQVVTVALHPSGSAFDGAAVVVNAYTSNGNAIVVVVSLADPASREVVKLASNIAA